MGSSCCREDAILLQNQDPIPLKLATLIHDDPFWPSKDGHPVLDELLRHIGSLPCLQQDGHVLVGTSTDDTQGYKSLILDVLAVLQVDMDLNIESRWSNSRILKVRLFRRGLALTHRALKGLSLLDRLLGCSC